MRENDAGDGGKIVGKDGCRMLWHTTWLRDISVQERTRRDTGGDDRENWRDIGKIWQKI